VGSHRGRGVPARFRRSAADFPETRLPSWWAAPWRRPLDAGLAGEWKDRLERILAGETMMLRLRHQACDWAIVIFPVRFQNRVYGGGSAVEITSWNAAEQELRHTVLGALKAQEFERRMVSKFLHDRVGQNLTALGLQLDLVRMDLETVSAGNLRAGSGHPADSRRHDGRGAGIQLRAEPSAVERAGLRSALDRLAARVRGRFTGALRVNVDPSLNLDPGVASAMYRSRRRPWRTPSAFQLLGD